MGIKASWIGVRGGSEVEIFERLGLVETGEIAFGGAAHLCCAQLTSGWFIVQGPEEYVNPERLELASANGEVVSCTAYETVMFSEAYGYRDGGMVWSVSHDPDRSENDLKIDGSPPPELGAIQRRLMEQQAQEEGEVDYVFEAPLEIVRTICGYRYDQGNLPPETVFRVVEPGLPGSAGERQARIKAQHDELTLRVAAELYPVAESLGFVPAISRPQFLENRYSRGANNVMVREKEGRWESLEFIWGFASGEPYVNIFFFVRRGAEARPGRQGCAYRPKQKRGLADMVLGRNKPEPVTINSVIAAMREVIVELDQHLSSGVQSPRIIPAIYAD